MRGRSFTGFIVFIALLLFPDIATAEELDPPVLRVGLTAVTLQKELELNQKLIRLIGEKMNIKTEIIYTKSYIEMSDLLKKDMVDIAYVCGLPYVIDHDTFGLELLAAPVFMGKPLYQSYLIVPADSTAKSMKDLEGKTFAFSDPLSNSGMLFPFFKLRSMGQTPESFFKKHFFSYGHANSIEAVAVKLADGASVDSYVYETMKIARPEITEKTRVIDKSDYMPITPLVMRPTLPANFKSKLKKVIYSLNTHPEGKEVLKSLYIDRFVKIKDTDYNSIRKMRRFVFGSKEKASETARK